MLDAGWGGLATATDTKKLIYDDYVALPEMRQRYEIIDGELSMAPAPTPTHQWIRWNLYRLLHPFVSRNRLGVVLMAPVDIVIRRDLLRTRQPDVLYLSAQRSGITSGSQHRGMQRLQHAPDLAIEILSPSNVRHGIGDKLENYRTIGVRECWLDSGEAPDGRGGAPVAGGCGDPGDLWHRDDDSLAGAGRICPVCGKGV
ncbi:MAG: Uma2 family endonuclease [Candidatus Entotheonellia bacterium]